MRLNDCTYIGVGIEGLEELDEGDVIAIGENLGECVFDVPEATVNIRRAAKCAGRRAYLRITVMLTYLRLTCSLKISGSLSALSAALSPCVSAAMVVVVVLCCFGRRRIGVEVRRKSYSTTPTYPRYRSRRLEVDP